MNNKVTHNQEQENQTFWNKFPFLLAIFLIPFFVSSCELPSQAVIELTPTREEISTQPVTQTPTIEPTKKATPEIPPVGTLLPDSGIVISPENIDQIQEVAVIHKPIFSRALFTPDGNYVVLATGKFIFTYKTDKWYPEESTYDSGDSAINPIALSPDGQRIAFGTGEGKIKIVATFNGTLLNSISGSRKSITTVVFSPDGITFASGSEQGEVKIWKTLNGDLSSTLPLQGSSIQSIAYSPDGKFLAVGAGDGTFSIWNIAEKNLLIKVAAHKYSVSDLHYSPDGQTIISAAVDHTIGIWNATTGINKQYFKVDEGVVDTPYKIAVSPDGENVAAGLEDGSAKIWNIRTGELKKELTGEVQYWKTRFIRSVDYSPDGKFLIATSVEGVIKIWEIATGAMDISSYLITGVVNNLSFSPDGQFLASSDTGVINLWRVADGQLLHSMSGTDYYEIYGLAISPDNKTFLSTAYDEGLQYWNTGSGSFIGNVPTRVGTGEEFSCPVGILDGNNPYNEEVGKISTCSSGDQVVAGGSWGSVFFWSFEKGGIEEVWNDVSPDHYSIHQVVCTQNGTLVAVSTFDDGVKVFRRASKELLHRFENIDQNSTAENISFSPDGTLLAIAYMDGPLDVVDTTDFHILYTIDAGGMIFSPDGRMGVIHAGENTIEFLDARRGTVLGSFQYPDDYCNLAFSPDGTKLMCGSTFGNIYLFEVVPTPGK